MGRIFDIGVKIAVDGHAGQIDKRGMPYILHPLAVALSLDPVPNPIEDDTRRAIAVMHDLFEDTKITDDMVHRRYLEDLWGYKNGMGFVDGVAVGIDDIRRTPEFEYCRAITSTIRVLTHAKNEPYRTYISRIRIYGQPAIDVKLADIAHNTSPDRMNHLSHDDQERLMKKYGWAKQLLERWDGWGVERRPVVIDVTKPEGDKYYITELVSAHLRWSGRGSLVAQYVDDLRSDRSYGHLLRTSKMYYTPGMKVVGWVGK